MRSRKNRELLLNFVVRASGNYHKRRKYEKKSAPNGTLFKYPCLPIKLFQPYLNAGILSKRRYDKEYP